MVFLESEDAGGMYTLRVWRVWEFGRGRVTWMQ